MAGFFDRLGVLAREVEDLIESSRSLRGFLIGYIAERKMVELVFPGYTLTKPDDHDRTSKGDRLLEYKGQNIRIEVKSLQSADDARNRPSAHRGLPL